MLVRVGSPPPPKGPTRYKTVERSFLTDLRFNGAPSLVWAVAKTHSIVDTKVFAKFKRGGGQFTSFTSESLVPIRSSAWTAALSLLRWCPDFLMVVTRAKPSKNPQRSKGQELCSGINVISESFLPATRSLERSASPPAFTALIAFPIGWFQSSSPSPLTSSSSSFLLPISPHLHAHYGGKLSHLWAGVSPGVTPVLYPEFGIS